MSGLLPDTPSVFSVGPGVRATYGTGATTATTSAIRTPAAATSSVAARRDMGGRLRAVDPVAVTAGVLLVLPDRHARLQLLDQRAAGLEGLGAVRAGHGHHDREVADIQVAHAVHGGDGGHAVAGRDLLGDPPQLHRGRGMGAVAEPDHILAVIVVPDRADEQRDAPGRRVRDRADHLVHRQGRAADLGEPDGFHTPKLPWRAVSVDRPLGPTVGRRPCRTRGPAEGWPSQTAADAATTG